MGRIKYTKGQEIGECIYLRDSKSKRKIRMAIFKCKCGSEFESALQDVKRGRIRSCGCVNKHKPPGTTHGFNRTKIYIAWTNMKQRCYYKKNVQYKDWGGRGITVCNEWRNDFMEFYNYVSVLPNYNVPNYSLDRIDNNGNYEPGNVRWATAHVQQANCKLSRNNKTGYIGVSKRGGSYGSSVMVRGVENWLGSRNNAVSAVLLRDRFIINNNIPEYSLQIMTRNVSDMTKQLKHEHEQRCYYAAYDKINYGTVVSDKAKYIFYTSDTVSLPVQECK